MEGRFRGPCIVTPYFTTVLPGSVMAQFPFASAARSTTTEPGRMPFTASSVIRMGALWLGMSAVVITTSISLARPARNSCCFLVNSSPIAFA